MVEEKDLYTGCSGGGIEHFKETPSILQIARESTKYDLYQVDENSCEEEESISQVSDTDSILGGHTARMDTADMTPPQEATASVTLMQPSPYL